MLLKGSFWINPLSAEKLGENTKQVEYTATTSMWTIIKNNILIFLEFIDFDFENLMKRYHSIETHEKGGLERAWSMTPLGRPAPLLSLNEGWMLRSNPWLSKNYILMIIGDFLLFKRQEAQSHCCMSGRVEIQATNSTAPSSLQ